MLGLLSHKAKKCPCTYLGLVCSNLPQIPHSLLLLRLGIHYHLPTPVCFAHVHSLPRLFRHLKCNHPFKNSSQQSFVKFYSVSEHRIPIRAQRYSQVLLYPPKTPTKPYKKTKYNIYWQLFCSSNIYESLKCPSIFPYFYSNSVFRKQLA